MLRYLSYHPQAGIQKEFRPEGFDPWTEEGRIFWLDLEAPTEEEVDLLDTVFKFHPLAVADCRDDQHRAKTKDFDRYLFITLHAVSPPARRRPPLEINIFWAGNFVVSVHRQPLELINRIYEEYNKSPDLLNQGTGFLFYRLSDTLTAAYFDLFDRLDEEIWNLEELIFTRPGRHAVNGIFALRRRLIGLRRVLGPQRDIFSALMRREDLPCPAPGARVYLGDIFEQYLRLTDQLSTFHDLATNILEAYLSLTSNRLNEIVKVLTVITTIMMPLSLIVGIYGMNFRYMPELNWRYGYYYALGLMAAVSGGMLYYFHRRGWL
ncbi:MAG: magnesium/cobalt transporter CorA [Clostridia bacterium]|nr:MAG: magnesium/cobalt transporter CorA [Clostridia bacterium]